MSLVLLVSLSFTLSVYVFVGLLKRTDLNETLCQIVSGQGRIDYFGVGYDLDIVTQHYQLQRQLLVELH